MTDQTKYNYDMQFQQDDLNAKFTYFCPQCGQDITLPRRDPILCTNFLLINGQKSDKRCYSTYVLKKQKPGWRYCMAR